MTNAFGSREWPPHCDPPVLWHLSVPPGSRRQFGNPMKLGSHEGQASSKTRKTTEKEILNVWNLNHVCCLKQLVRKSLILYLVLLSHLQPTIWLYGIKIKTLPWISLSCFLEWNPTSMPHVQREAWGPQNRFTRPPFVASLPLSLPQKKDQVKLSCRILFDWFRAMLYKKSCCKPSLFPL